MTNPVWIGAGVVPSLLVSNMAETLDFYGRLGFRLSGIHPNAESPTWAQVSRDKVVFQFYTEPPQGTPSSPTCSGTLYIYPEDVIALAKELEGKVTFAWGPEVMPYGMREFAVQDPNGYFVAFTEHVRES